MKSLDLGCGENKVPNSIGLDNVQLPGVDVEHDLLNFPYPFENESIDKIYLRHVIEHFAIENINFIMNECNRILKNDDGFKFPNEGFLIHGQETIKKRGSFFVVIKINYPNVLPEDVRKQLDEIL